MTRQRFRIMAVVDIYADTRNEAAHKLSTAINNTTDIDQFRIEYVGDNY